MNGFSNPSTSSRRALVIGASVAGLLAARILSERFTEVVLLERDTLPDRAAPRKGTPQAVHPHGLLARGRQILDELFPGFTDALVAQGALAGDLLASVAFNAGIHRLARNGRAGIGGLAVSRLALEAELRRRVLALVNVRAMTGINVNWPLLNEGGRRVSGVLIARADGSGGETTLAADLVIDCTGRGSRTPAWLQCWGYPAPEEVRVTVGLRYTTAYFPRGPKKSEDEPNVVICSATPLLPRPAVLLAQEPEAGGGCARWVIGVGGYAGDPPGATLEALRKRTLEMGCDELIRACHASEPIGDVLRFQFPFSQRRHYERLARFPDNYLVMGDALTSFNPIYGQGMTVAACEALALRDALQEIEPLALRQRFFAAAAKLIDTPWQLAVGADLALPFVEGPRSLPQRLIGAYIARLHRAAVHDVNVSLAFQKVVHLLAPPSSLFAPGIVARVLVGGSSVRHRLSEGSGVAARTCTPANAAYSAHPPSAGEQP